MKASRSKSAAWRLISKKRARGRREGRDGVGGKKHSRKARLPGIFRNISANPRLRRHPYPSLPSLPPPHRPFTGRFYKANYNQAGRRRRRRWVDRKYSPHHRHHHHHRTSSERASKDDTKSGVFNARVCALLLLFYILSSLFSPSPLPATGGASAFFLPSLFARLRSGRRHHQHQHQATDAATAPATAASRARGPLMGLELLRTIALFRIFPLSKAPAPPPPSSCPNPPDAL